MAYSRGGGASTFEDLTDADTIVGTANKYWHTNAAGDTLKAATLVGGGDVVAPAINTGGSTPNGREISFG